MIAKFNLAGKEGVPKPSLGTRKEKARLPVMRDKVSSKRCAVSSKSKGREMSGAPNCFQGFPLSPNGGEGQGEGEIFFRSALD